jgi:DNA-binding GntR family transcriptional regulator
MTAVSAITLPASDETAAASIAEVLRRQIVSGQRPLGSRISDKQIALELSVSRTPVREALLMLQARGLVVLRPQSGSFVVDLSASDMHAICAARSVLEIGALRLAAAGDAAHSLAVLGKLVSRASVALADGDLAGCDELDCEFHEAIVDAGGNAYLKSSYSSISDQLRALRHRLPKNRERMARAIAQHRRIIDLWSLARVDEAAAELAAHVANIDYLLSFASEPTAAQPSTKR